VRETVTNDPQGPVGNGELTYSLDPVGNRLSMTSSLAAIPAATYSYDQDDQLGGDTYDLNGNTTAANGHTFAYDFENHLISKDGGAVRVVYDGDGNRVAKTVGGVTTKYLVDDLNPTGFAQVMEEISGGAVQVGYTYGSKVISQRRGGATSYYGCDAHGNVTFLTDANGVVTDTYDYDAWGNIVARTGSTPNSRLYTGQEFDPDVGFVNLRARYYDARRGRFASIDPMPGSPASPLSFHRYLYAGADPVNGVDPLGTTVSLEYAIIVTGSFYEIMDIGFGGYLSGMSFSPNWVMAYLDKVKAVGGGKVGAFIDQFGYFQGVFALGAVIACQLSTAWPDLDGECSSMFTFGPPRPPAPFG
jgi:RHS repeat-associated protein